MGTPMVSGNRNDGPVLAAVVRESLTMDVTFELRCLMRRSRVGGLWEESLRWRLKDTTSSVGMRLSHSRGRKRAQWLELHEEVRGP